MLDSSSLLIMFSIAKKLSKGTNSRKCIIVRNRLDPLELRIERIQRGLGTLDTFDVCLLGN